MARGRRPKLTEEQRLVRVVWANMIERCTKPARKDFPRYGGAGIKVAQIWIIGDEALTGFAHFFNHIGPKPSKFHSIDRINSELGYEPGNVRWATIEQQANNKRTNRVVSYHGQQMTVAQAVRAAGSKILRETAICRLNSGWPVERAVETPNTRPYARSAE